MASFEEELRKRIEQGASPNFSGGEKSTPEMMLKSAFSSMGELFGKDAPRDVAAWRVDNPGKALASELLGMAVPYGGWAAGASRIPRFTKALDRGVDFINNPLLRAGARNVGKWAPFEASRIAASAIIDEGNTGEVAGSAAINLAVEAALGGVGGYIRALPVRRAERISLPGINYAQPPQLVMRDILEAMPTFAPELQDRARAALRTFGAEVRSEQLPGGEWYVGRLRTMSGLPSRAKNINRLFRVGKSTGIDRIRMAVTGEGFASYDELAQYATRVGMPENYEAYGRFFRVVSPKKDNVARLVEKEIREQMTPVGRGTFMARDVDDGMWVMARRVEKALPVEGMPKDEWVVWKTDTPHRFQPEAARWVDNLESRTAYLNEAPAPIGSPIYDTLIRLKDDIPATDYAALTKKGRLAEGTNVLLKKFGLDEVAGQTSRAAGDLKAFAKEFLSPFMFQFTDNAMARWLASLSKATFDRAAAEAEWLMWGKTSLPAGTSLYRDMFLNRPPTGGVGTMIRAMDEEQLRELNLAWLNRWTPEEAAKMGVSDSVLDIMKQLMTIDAAQISAIKAVQRATGNKELKAEPMHMMISRTWQGDFRTEILDESNRVVYYASGKTLKESEAAASELLGGLDAKGGGFKQGKSFISDRETDVGLARQISRTSDYGKFSRMDTKRQLKRFETPQGVGGFTGSKGMPWTKKDLEDIIAANIVQNQRYMADLSVRNVLAKEFDRLRRDDPKMFNQLMDRLDDMAGVPSAATKWQNAIVDKALAPVLGKNSATKIVRTANSLMFHFMLGMGNVAFPVLNALTFMQTVMPEAAFVLTAGGAQKARHYSFFMMPDAQGRPGGGMGMLDMFKLLKNSFREMGKPDETLIRAFERGQSEGVLTPRLVEEYVGEKSIAISRLREAIKSPGGMVDWMKAVSEFAPGASEKFARGHAFTVGHIIGRDVIGIKDKEQLYRFAAEFTNRTMFGYGTVDRARIMTSPLGSAFGLFKNWQMHYMSAMMGYTGEAFMRGNWKPLLWMTAGTTAVGGVAATPLMLLAEPAAQWLGHDNAMELLYDTFPNGDAIYYGLPSLAGVSLTASASVPFANPARDASQLAGFAYTDLMRRAAGVVGDGYERWLTTGEHPGRSEQWVREMVRTFAPKSVYRTMAVWEDKTLRSMNTGQPVLQDLSLGERLLYAMSLTPPRVDKRYAISNQLWENQNEHRRITQNYGQAMAEAMMSGDSDARWLITKQAIAAGADIGSVMASANERYRRMRTDQLEAQFGIQERREKQDLLE